jgi:hypothetical protein
VILVCEVLAGVYHIDMNRWSRRFKLQPVCLWQFQTQTLAVCKIVPFDHFTDHTKPTEQLLIVHDCIKASGIFQIRLKVNCRAEKKKWGSEFSRNWQTRKINHLHVHSGRIKPAIHYEIACNSILLGTAIPKPSFASRLRELVHRYRARSPRNLHQPPKLIHVWNGKTCQLSLA